MIRTCSYWFLACFFIGAGLMHFVSPGAYLQLMPPSLPAPLLLILISGAAEIAGGAAVLIARLRKAGAWGLLFLLLAVFPANIHAAFHGMVLAGQPVAPWILWFRLPLQFILMAWVYWTYLVPSGEKGRA